MATKRIAVLTSGGIDSNLLTAFLLKRFREVWPVYVCCGFVWERAELFWLRRYLAALKGKGLRSLTVLNLPFGDIDKKGWWMTGRGTPDRHSADKNVLLPGRNLLLLSKAAVFCATREISLLAIGSLRGNPFSDATREFFRSFSRTASKALGHRIRVVAPFQNLRKREIFERRKKLPLHLSFSCLNPRNLNPCGRCNKCAERERLFLSIFCDR